MKREEKYPGLSNDIERINELNKSANKHWRKATIIFIIAGILNVCSITILLLRHFKII